MSNLYEKTIKIAYENRANAMIAAKKAADDGRIAKAVEAFKGFMASHPNIKKGATAGLWGGAAMIPTYGITRALGGTPGQAWRNAGYAGAGTAAAKATYDYRNEIKGGLGKAGEAIKGLFDKVKSKPAASYGQNKPSAPTTQTTSPSVPAKQTTPVTPKVQTPEDINQLSQPQIDPEAKYTAPETPYQPKDTKGYDPNWNKPTTTDSNDNEIAAAGREKTEAAVNDVLYRIQQQINKGNDPKGYYELIQKSLTDRLSHRGKYGTRDAEQLSFLLDWAKQMLDRESK